MANVLISASTAKPSAKSGSSLRVTVRCEVDDAGQMTIGTSDGFSVSPDSRSLRKGQLSDVFDVVLTRGNATAESCDLSFGFHDSDPVIASVVVD